MHYGVAPFLLFVDGVCCLAAMAGWREFDAFGLVLLVVVLALNATAGLYRSRLTLSLLDDLPALCGRGFAAAAIVLCFEVWLRGGRADRELLAAAAMYVVLVLLARALAYGVVRGARSRRLVAHRTLILGAGQVGGQLAELMTDHPEYGLLPVGFVDDAPLLDPVTLTTPVLGGLASLSDHILDSGATQVVIAFAPTREAQLVDILRTCDRMSCEIFFVPRLFEVAAVSRDMDELWGMPLVRLRRAPFRTAAWRLKRVLDVVVSGLLVVLLSPVLMGCALAVRLEGLGPILFRQQRYGLDGRPFEILKFRTLRPATSEEAATLWSVATDDRVSRVGRFLRRTSLDELPQLWNVLVGDMSLVGPRPERPHFVAEFRHAFPRYMARHRVPAGLTGWAQVHGLRGDTSIADRARFDNRYVENWTLWSDVKILLRTVGSVVGRHGA